MPRSPLALMHRWPLSVLSLTCLTVSRERNGTGSWKLAERKHMTRVIRRPHSEVERSKVRVTRPINTVTENQPYLRNGKAGELQTWYTDGVQWPASSTCVATSKLKALSGCSSHHLQGAETYCVDPTTGRTASSNHSASELTIMLCGRRMKQICWVILILLQQVYRTVFGLLVIRHCCSL